jgi:hypothetical protein
MAETSKNKIYYNDNENSVADVLADMKKMAESTDKAIENSKYNDAQIKKDISDAKKEQALKDAEQDNKIIELQNEKTELEKELKEAQEDFYQNSIRGQASGEYIHVEDSSNCRARIGISGNSEQETRSGKNKIDLAKCQIKTYNGITSVYNKENNSITFNGTCTADNTSFHIFENGKNVDDNNVLIKNNSTLLAQYVNGSINGYSRFRLSDENWGDKIGLQLSALSSTNKKVYATYNDVDATIKYLSFRFEKGTILNNFTVQLMLTDKVDTEYEMYGASPSPNYLSETKCVGSNVNEFDIDTVKDGFLNEKTGEIISNNSWKCSDFIEILNKTYTFGWESSSDYFQVTVCYYDENKKFISGKSYGLRGTFNNTFEVVSNAKYMKIAYSVSVRGELVTREKIKLEKGKVATPYSKYGQGCVKVTKCNNNLFNKNDIVNKAYINSSGEIVSNDGQNYTNYISVVSNAMYTIHAENPLGAVTAICFYDTNKKFLSGSTYNNVKSMSFKTPSNCDFVRASVSNINLETLQIEEGPATTYEEHEEQSYIMPVQKEMLQGDYFDFDNEKEEHKWIKLIFDGTENWLQSGNTYPTFYISPYEIASKFGIPAGLKAFCNYFSQKSNIWGIDEIGFDTANLRQDHVDFRFCLGSSSTITTLEAWKKKLVEMHNSGKPLALYFQILNLNELDFTDEQKAVAKELNNARTYKNVTNITTDSKAILSLDYAKDLETQNQKMQNEIDEIKQLLSTTQTSALLLDNMQTDIESEVE